jgi:hypothetical protein
MHPVVAMVVLCSPMLALFGLVLGLSCLFLRTCPACKRRIARTATKCHWCHTLQPVRAQRDHAF